MEDTHGWIYSKGTMAGLTKHITKIANTNSDTRYEYN